MKSAIVFDTAIGTSNLGDEIILHCLEEQLSFFLDNCFIMRFGTHVKNLPKARYFFGSQKLQFAYEADFKLIMGTNLLSRDIKQTQGQWPIGKLDCWLYDICIMAGVGTTLSEGTITNYSKKVYQQILRQDFYHSVRDEESKRMLEEIGFKAVNTGCPTLWKMTPDFCKQIPVHKSNRVIFSLSGYKVQQNRERDLDLIRILRENYDELIFWAQTSRDEPYLDTFENVSDIPRIHSLKKYEDILSTGNIDYVGTRLHGGVYAMQHKVRSIIISIDHRARGFHETNNLCICERNDIPDKLADMINGEVITDIRLRQEDIDLWKAQFNKEYQKSERKTHEDLLSIKLIRFPRKTAKKIKKFLIKQKKFFKRRLKNIKKMMRKRKKAFKAFFKKAKKKSFSPINKIIKKLFLFYIKHFYSKSMKKNPIEKGTIMFFPFQGDYTCNPKYISEEIFQKKFPWRQVWVTLKKPKKLTGTFPSDVKVVQFNTKEYYNELSRAQIWIDNAFNFPKGFVDKKKEQTYIQTMHGSLGLKKIGPDVVDDEQRNARGFLSASLTDICISNSSFETMVYRTSFWDKNRILELGHARNDIFFIDNSKTNKIKNKVLDYFGLAPDIHLALYAPTFRKDKESSEFEDIDFTKLKDALEKRFGNEWVILNRAHHSNIKKSKVSSLPYVLNANDYPDIQELMIAIDIGITDYSSWICDYVLTYKPGFLYTPDLNLYHDNRGFYYPLQETPFPICCNNDELVDKIFSFDENKYKIATDNFLAARGCVDDGHSSERIVQMLMEIIENKKAE